MSPDEKQVLTEWLVLAARGGDESAFRNLHQLWQGDLRRFAAVRLGQPAAADEVAAEAWLSIARGLHRLDDPACFPRWAMRIIERRCADWIRRQQRERRNAEAIKAEAEELGPAAAPTDPEPREDVLRLRRAIACLPAEPRELLHLYYELGRGVAEIAEIVSLPAGTVKSRLFSLRETLRQQLERTSS